MAADNLPCRLINYMLGFVPKGLLMGPICNMKYTLLLPACTYDETGFC